MRATLESINSSRPSIAASPKYFDYLTYYKDFKGGRSYKILSA
jgi:hypothetical protein